MFDIYFYEVAFLDVYYFYLRFLTLFPSQLLT